MALSPVEKVRRYRRRKKAKLEVWQVVVDPSRVVNFLIDEGLLSIPDETEELRAWSAEDRAVAATALSNYIADRSRR